MSKKSASILAFGFLSLVFGYFLVFSPLAFAHHQVQVLGESTVSSQIIFPPVTSGAGFFLPDSPLFFLDKTFQKIRLFLAFTSERRAKVRAAIAGERLAELRIMLSRNNPDGIATALSDLTEETNQMAATLTDAAASGQDVKILAKELNETIKLQRKILGILEDQTDGVLRLQVKAVREALKEAKVEIEDELEENELENEIEDDLEDEIEDHIRVASDSAKGLEHAIGVLTRLASRAAEKQQTRREEALRHAIEVKNDALIKQQERALEGENKKQERLLKAKEKFLEKTREAVEKAHEAVREFQEDQREINENEGPSENSGPSSNDSKDNSGSGSSGSSGSGSSGSDDD